MQSLGAASLSRNSTEISELLWIILRQVLAEKLPS